ncbi:unnamed protein product, partial [Didymodactylos carnosus]
LTDDTMPPKRAWNKTQLIAWLESRDIAFTLPCSKAELLELAFSNVPKKKYVVDEAARVFDIKILRLPVKHCCLNPIEIAWSNMKNYVRDNNVNFRLSEVETLSSQWMAALDPETSSGFYREAERFEDVFKKSDAQAEELENELIDEDKKVDSDQDTDSFEDDD